MKYFKFIPLIFLIFSYYYCFNFVQRKKILFQQILNFKTYSQYYEDLILFCIFYDIEKGFYIDIGANDPDSLSVTKAFYLEGWKGINIEPLPEKFNFLLQKRPNDINLQIAVGKKKENSILYLQGFGSTLKQDFSGNKNTTINIKIDTMLNVCKEFIKTDIDINFCKIDVEGWEKNVLLGFDFDNCRPQVFVIESTFPGTYIPCHASWEYLLLSNDYSFVYQYEINRFYVDNKIPSLKEKFKKIDKYIQIYEKNKENSK